MIMSRVRALGGEYMGLLSGLVLLLIITFSVMDYLWFYVFFESSLIPILLIIFWGGAISLSVCRRGFICYFILYLVLCLCWFLFCYLWGSFIAWGMILLGGVEAGEVCGCSLVC